MSLRQMLKEAARGFLVDRMVHPLTRAGWKVDQLIAEGRTAEALSWIEIDAGVTPDLYFDLSQLRERLRTRLRGADPNLAAFYVRKLAWALWREGRRDQAAAVYTADFDLSQKDFQEPLGLATRLRIRIAPLSREFGVGYVLSLAQILGLVGRQADQLSVLEADLGLERDIEKFELLRAFRKRLDGIDPDGTALYIMTLWGALFHSGRREEAIWVLEDHLGLEEADYADADSLRRKMKIRLESLDISSAGLLIALCFTLEWAGKSRGVLALMEGLLNLSPELYDDLAQLTDAFDLHLGDLVPEVAWGFIGSLALALISENRNTAALAVCRAAALFAIGNESDPGRVGAALRARREALAIPDDTLMSFLGVFSITLAKAGDDARSALKLLEGYGGLLPEDYQGLGVLAVRLSGILEPWSEGIGSQFCFHLLLALEAAREEERADLLVELYVDTFGRVSGREDLDYSVFPGIGIFYDRWLECFGKDPEKNPVEVCRDLLRNLRTNFVTQGVRLKDRIDFITDTKLLRISIVETGLFWARCEVIPERAAQMVLEVQLWDAELTQRLLIERFLLEPISPVSPGAPPVQGWPWRSETDRPDSESHLPDADLTRRELEFGSVCRSGSAVSGGPGRGHPTSAGSSDAVREGSEHYY